MKKTISRDKLLERLDDLNFLKKWFERSVRLVEEDLSEGLAMKYEKAKREQKESLQKLRVELRMLDTQVESVNKALKDGENNG